MAAIAYPTPHPRQVEVRPTLRVVRSVPRPSDAVYRRRRLAAVVLAAGVLLAVSAAAMSLLPTSGPDTTSVRTGQGDAATVRDPAAYGAGHISPPPGSVYVVQPGDTVWTIARRLVPEGDIRAEVDRLVDLNGTAAVQAGQRLRLAPATGS